MAYVVTVTSTVVVWLETTWCSAAVASLGGGGPPRVTRDATVWRGTVDGVYRLAIPAPERCSLEQVIFDHICVVSA